MEEIRWMPHKYMTKNMWIYHHLKYFGDGTNIGLFLIRFLIGCAVWLNYWIFFSSSILPTILSDSSGEKSGTKVPLFGQFFN